MGNSPLLRLADSPPNADAFAYAMRLIHAGYIGSFRDAIVGLESGPTPIIAPLYPIAYWFQESGTKVLIIMGTTSIPDEGGPQFLGWQQPTEVDNGLANSWYRNGAIIIESAMPGGVDVVIGHSMGAGIALELTRIARQSGSPQAICCCIASPRARDATAAAGIGTWATFISYEHDPVPYLPGSVPLGADWRHGGRYFVFNSNGSMRAAADDYSSVGNTATLLARWLPAGGHAVSTYLNAATMAILPPHQGIVIDGGIHVIDP